MESEAVAGRINMLAGLSPEEQTRLGETCRPIKLRAGERVFSEGEQGDELFIVQSGKVKIVKAIAGEVTRTLAVVDRGGVFGELVIVDAGPRSASAEASTDAEVLALGRDAFQRLVTESHDLGVKILGRLAASIAERLRLTNDLLRETLAWGLEVSGAASLNVNKIVRTRADVRVTLLTGKEVAGHLVKVDRSSGGIELTIMGEGDRLRMVPYHAIAELEFPGDLLAANRGGTEA